MLVGREVRRRIQMNRSPVPSLRHYPGQAKSYARSAAGRGQQRTELRGNAWAGLVLKNARLDHVFQECGVGDADRTDTFGQRLCRALQTSSQRSAKPKLRMASDTGLVGPAHRTHGLKFDLDFPQAPKAESAKDLS